MSDRYRFADCELQLDARQLLVRGAPAPLGSRAFDLLRVLVQQRERPVSKNELLDAVWPGLDVEDGNLPVQISALRKLLGPQAIATVPGLGYRFTLRIEADEREAEPAEPTPVLPAAPAATAPRLSNLPASTPRLIGRDAELAEIAASLDAQRLLSLVGTSGIGKTRLAQAAAQRRLGRHRDGVWWVDLAELEDGDGLPARVAATLGVPAVAGAPQPLHALAQALHAHELLLVLDNCEHLVEAVAALVQTLLAAAPALQCMATTQEPLKVAGEEVLRVAPLGLPPAGTPLREALEFPALALLNERARAVDRRFVLTETTLPAAIDICRQLDGIALAIEMAAARLPWMGVTGVHQRLCDRLRLLSSDTRQGLARHRTLQAALDWSHALLSPSEQAVFRRLAVFHGGFTLDTLAPVAQDGHVIDRWDAIDALGALVDKSLVQVERDAAAGAPRYRLLESSRLFALAQLDEAGEGVATLLRHAEAFTGVAVEAMRQLMMLSDSAWLQQTEPEADNLRAALNTVLDGSTLDEAAVAQAVELYETLSRLDTLLSGGLETRRWAERLEGLVDKAAPPVATRLLLSLGSGYRNRAPARCVALCRRALALSNEAPGDAVTRYRAQCALAIALARLGDTAAAAASLQAAQALVDPQWPPRLRLLEADAAGFVATGRDDAALAQHEFRRFHALALQAGAESGLDVVAHNLADLALQLGDADEAVRLGQQLVAQLRRQRNGYMLAFALGNLCAALLQAGRPDAALNAALEALPVLRREDNALWLFDHLALAAVRLGHDASAARLIGYVDAARAAAQAARDRSEAQAREQAQQALSSRMDATHLARLHSEGALFDAGQVDALVRVELLRPA